ncbi:MAG TPA: hypothetical protein VFL42_14240, partial [Terriglobales bacterium]|nr:hypothetical protein [Terriglobales bacterium]
MPARTTYRILLQACVALWLLVLTAAAQTLPSNDSPESLERKMRLLDEKEVQRVLEQAEKGNPNGQLWAGVIYEVGQHVERDETKATQWFSKAAEQGSTAAEFMLGQRYWKG